MKFSSTLHIFERLLLQLSKLVLPLLIIGFIVRFFILGIGEVNGPSMEPGFHDKDIFLVHKLTYFFEKPNRFDIVQIVDNTENKLMIKRIIALPGESILIKNGKVFLLRKQGDETIEIELTEPYLLEDMKTKPNLGNPYAPITIEAKENEYIVLGDNRKSSNDSRNYGAVPRSRIVGKVVKINVF